MTDKVNPSINRPGNAHETAVAIAQGGGASPGWVVPAGEVYLADEDNDVDDGALNAFDQTSGGASLDVTIDPGEAFVEGAWCVRDVATTVTLDASTAGQTVYAGWKKSERDTMLIGTDAIFGVDDRKIPIWEFDTDGSGVTDVTDLRDLGPTHRPDRLETKSARITQGRGFLGLPVHHVEYEDGLADEEIARFSLEADSVLEVWSLEVKLKGGGTNVDFSVDIYDVTNASVIASTTDKAVGGADPVGESGPGATIIVRVSNATGGPVEACLSAKTAVVEDA